MSAHFAPHHSPPFHLPHLGDWSPIQQELAAQGLVLLLLLLLLVYG
jgi:hypothetical protein